MPLLLFRAKNVLFVFLFGGVSAVLSFFFFLFFCFFFFANSTPAGQKLFNLPHRTGGLDVAEPTVVSADATSKRMRINGIVLSIQTSLSSFPLFPPFSSATALFFAKDCGRWCRISRAREISRKNNGKRLRGRKREPERRIRHEDDCGFSRESGVGPHEVSILVRGLNSKSFVRGIECSSKWIIGNGEKTREGYNPLIQN